MNLKEGLVYRSTGSWYTVKLKDGGFVESRIKGKFRTKGIRTTNPVAVGDIVMIDVDKENKGVIHQIEPRKNYMIRKSVNLSKEAHVIAANLDLCVLITTLINPVTSTGFIDRFTVTAQAYDIPLLIVFNKIDLYTDEDLQKLDSLIISYENAGCSCVKTSALNKDGVEDLKVLIKGKVSLFSGHSGSGKSSLINAIDSKLELKVGEISDSHLKGKHTTTFAEMYELNNDTKIIDSPGIKGFGLIDLEKEELSNFFPEMFSLLKDCKFHNCKHINEPGCAVIKAVSSAKIPEFRYLSYLAMYHDDGEENYRTTNY